MWRIAPPREHRDVGRAAADIDQAHAELLLVVGEHRVARRELLEHDVLDREAAALHALHDVLRGALGAGDDVHLRFQAHARHADRLADAFLAVDQEFLRQDVQDLLVGRNRDRARRVDDALDVFRRHFFVADRDDAVRVQAAHVAAGDARVHRVDLAAGHQLGFFDRALDRLHRRLDVHDDAALQAARRMRAEADDFDATVVRDLADDRHDLRRADVEADDQVAVILSRHRALASSASRATRVGDVPADRETVAVAQVDVADSRRARCATTGLAIAMKRSRRAGDVLPAEAHAARRCRASAATRRAHRARLATSACRPRAGADRSSRYSCATCASVPGGPDQLRQLRRDVPRVGAGTVRRACSSDRPRPSAPPATCSVMNTRTPFGQRRSTRARSTHGMLSSAARSASRSTERKPAPRNGATTSSICTGATR